MNRQGTITTTRPGVVDFAEHGARLLQRDDPDLFNLLEAEYRRQQDTLAMVASCSPAHPSTLCCEGSFVSNVTAEGYPNARYHAGCRYVDNIEQLAIDRAKMAFRARYANVQPHSASTANQIVTASLMHPGETLLGLDLDCGGHLSHGSRVNVSGRFYRAVSYGLDADGVINYAQVDELACTHRPKVIICGTTAYPRAIDWSRFREIADRVGAYLLADITHIAGLVIAGEHESPIDVAHVTTTCTHKQLYGPRGGLILMGRDSEAFAPDGKTPLSALMQRGVFPFMQGAPIVNSIAAKARALGRAMTPEFQQLAQRIVRLAKGHAARLRQHGAHVISHGTDNHIVVIDVFKSFGITGLIAEKALQECGIVVNKNRIPGDTKPVRITSGIRIGTNGLAARRFSPKAMDQCTDLMIEVLRKVGPTGDSDYSLDPADREEFRREAKALCDEYPIIGYPSIDPKASTAARAGSPPVSSR